MKNKILFILILFLFFSLSFKVFASELCSQNGYTIVTINGIFTNEREARENKDNLKKKLSSIFNNQPLTVDYIYNPTHLAGAGDVIDSINQGLFDSKYDYDLVDILNDASQKVRTQKVLLVGHSQGNFYANNFYDKVASQEGGVPSESIGIYSVATPDDRVAGGGKYLTSDTDDVIASTVADFINILPPNVHIPLQDGDGNGHAFAEVYLEYQGNRIISEIENSLSKLKENDEQISEDPCISPQKLNVIHKVVEAAYIVADPTSNLVKDGLSGTYNFGSYLANIMHDVGITIGNGIYYTTLALGDIFSTGGLSANVVESLPDSNNNVARKKLVVKDDFSPDEELLIEEENVDETDTVPELIEPIINQKIIVANNTIQPVATAAVYHGGGGVGGVGSASTVSVSESISSSSESSNTGNNNTNTPDNSSTNNDVTPTVDVTSPVITILGNSPEIVMPNSIYTDAGATALDDIDGVINVTTTGTVDTSTLGVYIITYTAKDLSLNTTTKTRTVVVDNGAQLDHPNFVTVSGNYAYVVSELSNALEIVDISNPATPVHKGSIINGTGGAMLYSPKAVAVSGDYAYVVSYSNALEIIDISNPASPVHKSTLYDENVRLLRPTAITISGNYAYIVSSGRQGVDIVDISNPAHPLIKGSYYINSLTSPSSVFVSGNYMYLTFIIIGQGGGGLHVVDISNPDSPILKSGINDGTDGATISYPRSVFVSNGYAYVTSWDTKSLEIIDVSDSNNPVHKGKLTSGFGNASNFTPNFSFISENYAYITSYVGETLEIVDISNPVNPVHKKSLANNTGGAALSYPTSIFISGNYAYVSSSLSNALEIVDISDPIHPVHKSKISNGEFNHTDSIVIPDPTPDPIPDPDPDPTPDPNPDPDTTAPTIISAKVNSNNTVDINFSEDLDGRTITNADFSVTGHILDSSADAFETSPGVVRLTITDTFMAGESPEIIYNITVSNGVKDLASNVVLGFTILASP